MMEMLQVEGMTDLQDPAVSENSQVIYCNEHLFSIRIQEKP